MASVNNLYGYSTQRITGLTSGMDTETIVNNLMASQQAKLDKLFQQKQKAQWKYDAYTSINTSVSGLRNSYLSVLGDKSLMKSSAYNAYKVTMADNSAVKVTGTASALSTSFKILSAAKATAASKTVAVNTQQTELKSAEGKYLQAQVSGTMAPEGGVTLATTVGELADQFGLAEGDESLSFSINGETFTFARSDTMMKVMTDINAKVSNTGVMANMSIDDETGSLSLALRAYPGKDSKISLANITGSAFDIEKGFGMTNGQVEKKSTIDGSSNFRDLAGFTSEDADEDTAFTINGETFTIGADETVDDVIAKVNAKLEGITLSFDEKTGSFILRNDKDSEKPRAAIEVSGSLATVMGMEEGSYTDSGAVKRTDTIADAARKLGNTVGDEITVKVNDKEFTFKTSASLSSMMSAINQDKDVQANFSYSEMTDSFQIANTVTGSDAELSFEGFGFLGFNDASGLAGEDAKLTVEREGITKEIVQSSNTFTLDGLTFEVTGTKDFGSEGLSVGVERDYQPTIDAIKGFIEDYNKMVGELTTKYYEKSYSKAYPPLTDEMRAALSEDEAAKWDEKAKSGILRNDAALSGLLSGLRSSLLAKVGDTGLSASDLGISTVSWSNDTWRTEQGKLTLDENKLMAALKENPNAVQTYFTNIATDAKGNTDTSTTAENGKTTAGSGLLVRMGSLFSKFNTAMSTQNIKNTQTSINEYTTKMSDLVTKMAEKEESLWAKYSKMETALSELQSQSNWLSAQLGLSTNS
ncbi:MAG: flagellar filament capping protein FliD [Candidatus Pelethousia sp.]|nr:flagellar filament capping protein FliD [Candidatus Pelethousia sp.]